MQRAIDNAHVLYSVWADIAVIRGIAEIYTKTIIQFQSLFSVLIHMLHNFPERTWSIYRCCMTVPSMSQVYHEFYGRFDGIFRFDSLRNSKLTHLSSAISATKDGMMTKAPPPDRPHKKRAMYKWEMLLAIVMRYQPIWKSICIMTTYSNLHQEVRSVFQSRQSQLIPFHTDFINRWNFPTDCRHNVSETLTICGMTTRNSGIFRPKRSVIHPNRKFPNKPPGQIIAVIHDASSNVIGPVGNGDCSDLNCNIAGDGQPHTAPYPIEIKFTEISNSCFHVKFRQSENEFSFSMDWNKCDKRGLRDLAKNKHVHTNVCMSHVNMRISRIIYHLDCSIFRKSIRDE